MVTVLVVPKSGHEDHREDWEKVIENPAHVDFIIDDLAVFLRKIVANEPIKA